jgi:hypothetical protein
MDETPGGQKLFWSRKKGRSMTMHPKTCAAVFYYEGCNDETRKAREAAFDQIKCSKVAEYKVEEIEEGIWKEFYCCSAHAQFYRDRNESANREVFVIDKLSVGSAVGGP